MISVKVDIANLADVTTRLKLIATEQMPFAISVALNRVVEKARIAEIDKMANVFDRPTPSTLSSVYYRKSTKTKLVAEVGLSDRSTTSVSASKYLAAEITGGQRRAKRFEVALRQAGILPSHMFAVPASGATFDAYGNMSRGQIVQILSYFRAFPDAAKFRSNMNDKGREKLARGTKNKLGYSYFVGRPEKGLPFGIWKHLDFRMGKRFLPVLLFVARSHYEKTFDFRGVVDAVISANMRTEFDAAVRYALNTARAK